MIISYGSYIYTWESKYQLVFWPLTETAAMYCCDHCGLCQLMGDFEELPKEKFDAVKSVLPEAASLNAESAGTAKEPNAVEDSAGPFANVPIWQRFVNADQVYVQLDTEPAHLCLFYRLMGYHCEMADKPELAKYARQRALELAEQLLSDPDKVSLHQEFYFICGAMQHLLGDDAAALVSFKAVKDKEYRNEEWTDESNQAYTEYLADLASEYETLIVQNSTLETPADSSQL